MENAKDYSEIIAKNLRKFRNEKKLRQQDVANYCKVTQETVSKWENKAVISADYLFKVCDLLEISADMVAERTRIDYTEAEILRICKHDKDKKKSIAHLLGIKELAAEKKEQTLSVS